MDSLTTRLLLSLLSLAVLATLARAADTEDEALSVFYRHFLDQELRDRPLEATRLGDHRYDNKLEDLSAATRAKWDERYRNRAR